MLRVKIAAALYLSMIVLDSRKYKDYVYRKMLVQEYLKN